MSEEQFSGSELSNPPPGQDANSYRQILTSSALSGASTLINALISLVRTKIMALMLEPAGFGLLGLFGSITDLAVSLAGLGVSSSAVRQIAEAASSEDMPRIASTLALVRRINLALGLVGAVALALLARPVSRLSFGVDDYAGAIALLSLAVFLRLVAAGETSLLQGMRRIGDVARANVLGATLGVITSIPIIYFFRESGVAPSLLCVAAAMAFAAWFYSRRLVISVSSANIFDRKAEIAALFRLGFAFMVSGFMTLGAAYVVRILIVRHVSLDAAGLYASAWTLGGLYVGYVLQAMGVDFYPRLVGAASDHPRCNQLVNEQAHVSMLLAGPGIIGTLIFAPLIVTALYSAKFAAAAGLLRWICLGMALRVLTWPLGFVIVAKNRQAMFLAVDAAWTVANIGLTATLLPLFGLNGAGVAFFVPYILHGALVYPIARSLTGFRWSSENLRAGALFLSSIAIAFLAPYVLPGLWFAAAGGVLMLLSSIYSIRRLSAIVSTDRAPMKLRHLANALRRAWPR